MGHKIPSEDLKNVKRIFEKVEGREQRNELNLYVTGYEDDPEETHEDAQDTGSPADKDQGQPDAHGAVGREPPAEPSAPGSSDEGEQR